MGFWNPNEWLYWKAVLFFHLDLSQLSSNAVLMFMALIWIRAFVRQGQFRIALPLKSPFGRLPSRTYQGIVPSIMFCEKSLALEREWGGTYPKRNALLVIVVNGGLLDHKPHYADYNGDCTKRSFIKHWFAARLALDRYAYQFSLNGKPSRKGTTLFRPLA